jgi:hypothetical protein
VIRRRNMALVRTTDYQAQGELPADVLNDDQDAPVLMLQQVQEQVDRSIKAPLGEGAIGVLPSAADRANKTLTFDADGNPTALATATDAAAEVALAVAARTAAEAAETNAETAEAAAEAAQTAAEVAATRAEAIMSGDNALAYQYETAFSIDATIDETDAAVITKIGDAVTQESLDDFHTFSDAVMIVAEDGSVEWAAHNLALQTNNLAHAAWFGSGLTKTTGQEGPSGELTAAILTVGSSPAFLNHQLSGTKISNYPGRYFLGAWKVKYDGTHRWIYIRMDSPATLRVYFDLQSGTVGTADAGITGGISRYDADGTLLPAGWFMVYAYQTIGAASFQFDLGLSDADANPAVTVGKTLRVDEPQTCYGVNPLLYMPATTVAVYGAPYTWETGGRTLLLYGGAVYSGFYSESLDNAVWTKTSCTAALDATGISGEPCSTLTATGANATCLQITVSAGLVQTFQPYIRRKTGTGAVSITMDNGGSWTDITSQINTTTYTRVYLHGVLANPTIGFKLATSGDEIEVCHANNVKLQFVSPPLPVYGAALTVNSIAFSNKSLPVSLAGSNVLAYYDGNLINDTAILSPIVWTGVDLSSSTDANMTARMNEAINIKDASGETVNEMYGAKEAGERVEITMYLAGEIDGNFGSINGEPSMVDYQRTVTSLDRFSMSSTGSPMQFVRKFLVAPTTLEDRDEVRTKHYQQGIKNNLYAAAIVAGAHEFASFTAGSDYERFPTVSVLKDYGDSVLLGVFWDSRDLGHFSQEFPIRIMQRNFVYDKVENTLVPVTDAAIVCQPSRWASHLGGSDAPCVIRVPSGANAGRLIMLYVELDSVSGTLVDDKRNIYIKTNDLEGDPTGWTAGTKLFDASVITSASMVLSPGGDHLILPANHSVAPGRFVVMYYATSNRIGSIYSDDSGATWSLGTVLTVAAPGATEPTLSMWPDGTLICTTRGGTGLPNTRHWYKSADAGVTWVDQGLITNISPDADCSASTVQLDPTGLTSPQGLIALSHATDNTRIGFQIEFSTANPLEFGSPIEVVNGRRWFSYSSIRSLFGGEYIACAVEYGSYGNVEVYPSVGLLIVKP